MGDEGNGNGLAPIEQGPAPRAVMVIRWEANGQMNVSYPMDEMVCGYMLKKAQQVIDREFEKLATPRVISAGGVLPPLPPFKRNMG